MESQSKLLAILMSTFLLFACSDSKDERRSFSMISRSGETIDIIEPKAAVSGFDIHVNGERVASFYCDGATYRMIVYSEGALVVGTMGMPYGGQEISDMGRFVEIEGKWYYLTYDSDGQIEVMAPVGRDAP